MKIEGLKILITGGAKGLGREMVNYFSEHGAQVGVLDIDKDGLSKLEKKIKYQVCDVTNEQQVAQCVASIAQELSGIDVLINNAGLIYSELVFNPGNASSPRHDYKNWKKVLEANLDSAFLVGTAVIEQMFKNRTKGLIINMSSISAQGNLGQSAYSAAKAGVEALTKTWAKELSLFGIRAVAIAPGFIETPSTNAAINEKTQGDLKKLTPLKRFGIPDEIVKTATFAINNDFVNGTILEVNGGLRL